MKITILLLLFSIFLDTCLFSQLTYVDKIYQGKGGIEGISNPNSIVLSPDGKNLYVIADKKSIAIFTIDPISADLQFVESMSYNVNGITDINGIIELEFSSDGKFAYGAIMDSHALIVFNRDSQTGKLNIIQRIANSEAANSLASVCSISVSCDGKFIYTASLRANLIGIFQRNISTGMLSYVDNAQTNLSGHDWSVITNGYYLLGSHDSKNLYISSTWEHAVVTFKCDSITGKLTFIQKLAQGSDIPEFSQPRSLTLSNDDRFIYAFNTYGINTLTRNKTNGSLSPVWYFKISTFPEPVIYSFWPCSGAFSQDSKDLLVSTNYDNFVFKFKVDSLTGKISADKLLFETTGFIYPEQNILSNDMIVINRNNQVAYVASYFKNSITIADFKDEPDGLSIYKEIKNGDNGLDYLNEPVSFVLTKNEKFAFISSRIDNSINSFSRNKTTGSLEYLNTTFTENNSPPIFESTAKLIISNDNKYLYTCTNNQFLESNPDEICVFSLDSANGNIIKLQNLPNEDTDVYGTLGFIDIAASYDNKNLYAITDGAIVKKYTRNLISEELSFNNNIFPSGAGSNFNPIKIIISTDDRWVYFIGQNAITVCSRDLITGDLSFLQNIYCLNDLPNTTITVYNSVLSYDQTSLFMLNNYSPFLIEYKRDINTGLLTFINSYAENDSIEYPSSISISKNKKFIYIGVKDFKIGVLRLNPNNGNYEYIRTINGSPVVGSGWHSFEGLAITSDDRSLYAISGGDKSITNFKPTLYLGNDINSCVGDDIILSPQANYKSYLWSTSSISDAINVNSSCVISIKTTNFFGETEFDTINITFHPIPKPDLGPDIELCRYPDEQITLNCTIKYSGFNWNTGEKTEQIMVNESGYYYVEVSDKNGCKNTDTIKVIVNRYPSIELGNDINICGNSYVIRPLINSGSTSIWNTGSTADTLIINESGKYNISVASKNGCEDSDSVKIILRPYPFLDLGPDISISENSSVLLNPGEFESYDWIAESVHFYYEPFFLIDSSIFIDKKPFTLFLLVSNKNCYSLDSIYLSLNPTGVKEYLSNEIELYPNPVKNKVYLNIRTAKPEKVKMSLYSVKGEIVYSDIFTNNYEINMSNYPNGIYLLEIKGDKIYGIRKLIKN